MKIEIPTKKTIKEVVKEIMKREEQIFYSELNKLRERIILMNDEIAILNKKMDMKT